MFYGAALFNGDVSKWKTTSAITFENMFAATSFNGDISDWKTGTVTSFENMFRTAYFFNQPIGSWNVSQGKSFNSMFSNAWSFNQDLSQWNMSKAADLSRMFSKASYFNQDLSQWNLSSAETMEVSADTSSISFCVNQCKTGFVVLANQLTLLCCSLTLFRPAFAATRHATLVSVDKIVLITLWNNRPEPYVRT